jgi:hypothetical protein
MLIALVFLILAACTATDPRLEDQIETQTLAAVGAPARAERVVIVSGSDITLPADESVNLFVVYNGTARIEGHASSVVVVNGTANFVFDRLAGGAELEGALAEARRRGYAERNAERDEPQNRPDWQLHRLSTNENGVTDRQIREMGSLESQKRSE